MFVSVDTVADTSMDGTMYNSTTVINCSKAVQPASCHCSITLPLYSSGADEAEGY